MAMNLSGGYAAGSGADMLQQILQRAAEQEQAKQRLALEQRQLAQQEADRVAQREIQRGQLTRQTEQDRIAAQDRQRGITRQEAADAATAEDKTRNDVLARAKLTPAGSLLEGPAAETFRKYVPELTEDASLNPSDLVPGTENPLKPAGRVRFRGTQAELPKPDKPQFEYRNGKLIPIGSIPPNADVHNAPQPQQPKDTTASDNARLDRSFNASMAQLNNLRKPYDATAANLAHAADVLNQNTPEADALVAPTLVKALVAGGGVRITQPEIDAVVGGRSKWESLKAAAQQWSIDPTTASKITPEQRVQIRALMDVAQKRVNESLSTLDEASAALVDAGDVTTHRTIANDARKKLSGVSGAASTGPTIGERRTSGGITAEWNGKAWVQVPAQVVR